VNKIAVVIALVVALVIGFALSRIIQPGEGAGPDLALGYAGMVAPQKLLRVPVSGIYPGGTPRGLSPDMQNPLASDPDAVTRGEKDFDSFNCSGCHMARGGGGMGPALSNDKWIYRSSPANIYLDIAQGRSKGMPAFGAMLPDRTIWELVAYVQSISQKPGPVLGATTSASPQSPDIEQVPAGKLQTATPWKFTEPMPPNGEKSGSDPGKYTPASPTVGGDPNKSN
jgi:cytochrome c oxidase cbb3-type subunit 3